jgi:4-amino-4-deoxy-L-arabinose transferase-like glycosyltransferase
MAEVLDRVEGVVPGTSPLIPSQPFYYPYAWLALLTVACLLPFSGRAFHVDDTLFVMAARHITHDPFNPYGFSLVWNDSLQRMSDITENPPLACYYAALIGKIAGWSERAMHLGFLVPALALTLGTYRLATHFTRFPFLATLAMLLTPGVIASDATIMCDPMMAALWVWAMVFWIEGLEPRKPAYLAWAGVLMGAALLTKYFGGAVVPLMAAYSVVRLRRLGNWMWYLLIPVGAAVAYLLWIRAMYGHNPLFSAVDFSNVQRQEESWVSVWTGLSFTGGCVLSVLALAPLMWSRKAAIIVGVIGALAAWALIFGFTKDFGARDGGDLAFQSLRSHWLLVGSQLTLFIAGGLLVLTLTVTDFWKRRQVDSLLLGGWVIGTFVFFSFLNWTVNVRGVLPLIPAAGILIARRFENLHTAWTRRLKLQVAGALMVSAAVSFWVTAGDSRLANSSREAAYQIQRRFSNPQGRIWYWGHWGFQYYMDQIGAVSMDIGNYQLHPGDDVVVSRKWVPLPKEEDGGLHLPKNLSYQDEGSFELTNSSGAATMNWELGAGFYSSRYGPLPFTFGHVPPERFQLLRVTQ